MSDSTSNKEPPAAVQSVDRAVSVLEHLAKQGEAGVTEIAAELGVHKSTVSRLVGVLAARGLVEQLGDRGRYVVGFGIVRLAGAATGRMDLSRLGAPVCDAMAEELGETVNIATVDGEAAINVGQARGTAAVAAHNWTGQRTPLHATSSGKVLLAAMPAGERAEIFARTLVEYTPRTILDPDELTTELDRIDAQGYATCFEEFELGMHAVAVPILGRHGTVVASLSASGPAYRLSRRRSRDVVARLRTAAAELSDQLGYLGQ
jgi:DNA-binding IclR family transcriptional regulator